MASHLNSDGFSSPQRPDGEHATPPATLLDLLHISDRSFPTGAFVHSGGLEWLLRHESLALEAVLRARLREQVGRLELPFQLAAYHQDPIALDARFQALTLPREARAASAQVGRQLLRNAVDLFEDAWLAAIERALPHGHQAIAFGCVGRALGISPGLGAEAYAFQAVRGQISAAQRLSRLGQTEAQRLLHRLKPAIREAVALARVTPLEDIAPFMPMFDIAAMAHERQEVRLFVS